MIRLAANPGVRWCRSLLAGSGFLSRGGGDNTHVQADLDLSVTLLELACPQVGKLAFKSILPLTWSIRTRGTPLRSRSRLHIRQWFGRWRIFRIQPRLRSPCGTTRLSRRRDRIGAGPLLDKT